MRKKKVYGSERETHPARQFTGVGKMLQESSCTRFPDNGSEFINHKKESGRKERIFSHIYKHHKFMVKSASELSWLFVHPFIALLSTGIFAYYIANSGGPPESVLFVLSGVIAWNFYDLTQRAVTYGLTYDLWCNSVKHRMVTASDETDFIIGNSIYGLITAYFVLIMVGIAGYLAFGFNVFDAGIVLIIAVVPVFIFAVAVGLIIDSLMIMKGHNWMSLIWSISGVIMIFSGIFYPVSVLPGPAQVISAALPTTYSMGAIRTALGFPGNPIAFDIMTGLLQSIVILGISIFIFRKAVRRSKTTGKLTQY